MVKEYKHLTPEQVDHFLEHGYIVLKGVFTREQSESWTHNIWVRLGMDPNDKSTWTQERIHMPYHHREPVAEIAPRAWGAMCELLGGEERVEAKSGTWSDAFIVNLGADQFEGEDKHIEPQDLDNWHVDGDFFVHFLDSPEQALLVIPVYSDIDHRGGGTFICPDGLDLIAKYLAKHPEGVLPTGLSFTPTTEEPHGPGYWSHLKEAKNCKKFVEITGEVGDVVLLHPLMLHSASKNHTRVPRIITNPPVSLKEPFKFVRDDPDEYSLVERKTLQALGVERFDFRITSERKEIVPARVAIKAKMLEEEKKRLAGLQAQVKEAITGVPLESGSQLIAVV